MSGSASVAEARRPTEREQLRAQAVQAAHERVLAERAADARYREEQATRHEADLAERALAEAERLKAITRVRFLTAPGSTPEQFEREWPALLAEIQRQQTLETPTLAQEYARMRRARGLGRVD